MSDSCVCCQGSCDSCSPKKNVTIDFLYLDLNVCDRCCGTETELLEAIDEIKNIMKITGMEVIARSVHIDTREKAIEHRLLSSPTIRVNGVDIDADIKETLCESCGDLCGDSVDCRVWTYQGKEYTVPPVAMIMDAALRIIYGTVSAAEPEAYLMPENLQKYFDALERKNHDAG